MVNLPQSWLFCINTNVLVFNCITTERGTFLWHWDSQPSCELTVIFLQQLDSRQQHGSVLRISDVQLIQVLLLQQLERVEVLVAIEQESGHVLLYHRNTKSYHVVIPLSAQTEIQHVWRHGHMTLSLWTNQHFLPRAAQWCVSSREWPSPVEASLEQWVSPEQSAASLFSVSAAWCRTKQRPTNGDQHGSDRSSHSQQLFFSFFLTFYNNIKHVSKSDDYLGCGPSEPTFPGCGDLHCVVPQRAALALVFQICFCSI